MQVETGNQMNSNSALSSNQTKTEADAKTRLTIHQLKMLGDELRTLIRDTTSLTNVMKARIRNYVGFENLKDTGREGESLGKAECQEAYKKYFGFLEGEQTPESLEDTAFIQRLSVLHQAQLESKKMQKEISKKMGKLAEKLPIWEKCKNERGFGSPMLGKIVGAAPGVNGNGLGDFKSPSHLFKWFGLDVVGGSPEGGGTAPRREKGKKFNRNPYNRSILWQLGDVLIKHGIRSGDNGEGPRSLSRWGGIYLWRKKYEVEKAGERGQVVVPATKLKRDPKGLYVTPNITKDGEPAMTEGHVHNRAKRCMEKKFLTWLWEEWNDDRREENRRFQDVRVPGGNEEVEWIKN